MSNDGRHMKRLAELRAQRRQAGGQVTQAIGQFIGKMEQLAKAIKKDVQEVIGDDNRAHYVSFYIDEYYGCRVVVVGRGIDEEAVKDIFQKWGMPKERVLTNYKGQTTEFHVDLPAPTTSV